jgi:hypothetical protein
MVRRKLTETANHFGGVLATARLQGHIKQLEKPSSSQGEISGAGLTYNRQHREKEGWREGGGGGSGRQGCESSKVEVLVPSIACITE